MAIDHGLYAIPGEAADVEGHAGDARLRGELREGATWLLEQSCWRVEFGNVTGRHDDDAIEVEDRVDSVRDCKNRGPLEVLAHRSLDLCVRFGVDRRRRLVQQKQSHSVTPQQCAPDRDSDGPRN